MSKLNQKKINEDLKLLQFFVRRIGKMKKADRRWLIARLASDERSRR